MYAKYDQRPRWYLDGKWLCAILLVPLLALATLFFALATITNETSGQALLKTVLQLSLLPNGTDERPVSVQSGLSYQAGEALVLLPGVEVLADASEIVTLSSGDAQNRIAGVLADTMISEGKTATLNLITNEPFKAKLEAAYQSTFPFIVTTVLEASLLSLGLDDGSRASNWRLLAQQNPEQEVQPLIGVLVSTTPDQLQGLSDKEIGQFALTSLANLSLLEGLNKAGEKLSSGDLKQRFDTSMNDEVRQQFHGVLATLLTSDVPAITSRLEQARDVLSQEQNKLESQSQFPVLASVDTTGLSSRDANQATLSFLASVAYTQGANEVMSLVSDAEQLKRMRETSGLIMLASRSSHRQFVRLAWLFSGLSALLIVLLIFFSTGMNRLLNVGSVIAASSFLGALIFWTLFSVLQQDPVTTPPVSLQSIGTFAYLTDLLNYITASFPLEAFKILRNYHSIVFVVGIALILLYFTLILVRTFRPRRRSLI